MITIKKFSKLKYWNSTSSLRELRKIEIETADVPMDPRIRSLRKNKLRKWLQSRQAALLCEGLCQRFGFPVSFSIEEDSDYDVVANWYDGTDICYAPIQLKEFVPEYLNDQQQLQDIIDNLVHYGDSKDLVVGIHVNRNSVINFEELKFPDKLNIGEIYIFGCLKEDQSDWFLYGDLLTKPYQTIFKYPEI